MRISRSAARFGSSTWQICCRHIQRPALNTSQKTEGKRTGVLAMKVGMLALFDSWGERHAVTVLQLDSCQVVQLKQQDTDGYTALQLGVGEAKHKRVGVSLRGHYEKAGLVPSRKLAEFRVSPDAILPVGTMISSLHFVPGQLVDVCGTSKGKGFAGVMKRWNFGGGRATHGNSLAHRYDAAAIISTLFSPHSGLNLIQLIHIFLSLSRIPGSTGCRQDPGRVFKNKKMPGRMGGEVGPGTPFYPHCRFSLLLAHLLPDLHTAYHGTKPKSNEGGSTARFALYQGRGARH